MNVVIMVGCSGSGKSTWVQNQVKLLGFCACCGYVSADSYFVDPETKEYVFDVNLLGEAHASCIRGFVDLCQSIGYTTVFVDNTNTTIEEIAPYYAIAKAYGHTVTIIRVQADVETCIRSNQHGVPARTIHAQQERLRSLVFPRFWEVVVGTVVNDRTEGN